MFLENELSTMLTLDGEWEFKLGDGPWGLIPVPSAWEAQVADKLTDGPALYRRTFDIPESWLGAVMIALEADAISFDATVRLNGELAGTHQGLWSPFQIDITKLARAGENTLEIEVWKPGKRFPVRETLSGFLPDVATTFGGLWQGIRLRVFSWAALSDVRVFAYGGGWIDVQGGVAGLGERRKYQVVVEALNSTAQPLARVRADVADDDTFAVHLEISRAQSWMPNPDPALYSIQISLRARDADIARATRRVGFRQIEIENDQTRLNSAPLHIRGVLDWGWDSEHICPVPARLETLANFNKARTLGFNLFKLCLFVPDETLFDVADETGMLLWLEMPLWLPNVTPALRELALREYREVFRRLHHHPSIVVLSLGCELNAQADAEFLVALDELAREWFPNVLRCDNSGSAEAYGGVATSLSDFYDYHFYTDPHFFQPLVQHFHRSYQPAKPWLYGEFCDADTLRDFSLLDPEPWWLAEATALDRDDFIATRDYKVRLQKAGVSDGGAALTAIARKQATAVRKYILEQTRANSAAGGYVVTGWIDTPITTSGIVDDRRVLKFNGEEWQQFNSDRVVFMDRGRRRQWLGGDRPAYADPFVWWSGDLAEIHLALSNGGPAVDGARLNWRLIPFAGPEIAAGQKTINVNGGVARELVAFKARMPIAEAVVELRLIAALTDETHGRIIARNIWKLWVMPRVAKNSLEDRADAVGKRSSFRIESSLTPDLIDSVRPGGSALIWLQFPDARFTRLLPFWRKAIHVFAGHPVWDRVPHSGFADLRFFSVATDLAIDMEKLTTV
ncbi:MAG TPA: hypothetical protein VI547_14055, partial [Anaerolineales bacterium]|nr:hypothetical protein [Anaerolineales bacterium]